MTKFSPWQTLIAKHYGGGDYAHIQSVAEARDVGDTLFTFLIVETDAKEDCDDWPEAVRRVDQAMIELTAIYELLRMHAPYLTERGKQDFHA